MYIAMNNFRVNLDERDEFDRAWIERDSFLAGFAGFKELNLLRGPKEDGVQHYASHTVWDSERRSGIGSIRMRFARRTPRAS